MKYFEEADNISEELANVLIHNKELLDNIETLKAVLFSRFLVKMGEAYQSGKESLSVSDVSMLMTNVQPGAN